MNRKEEIQKDIKIMNNEIIKSITKGTSVDSRLGLLILEARLDERIRAEAEIQEILLEHTQLTYEVGKLKEQLTKLNAKNQSHITRQRNELAKLKSTIKQEKTEMRKCKNCGSTLSIYNDEQTCSICDINPSEVNKILKELKGIADGKIELN
jgi:hypothetical protein